MKKFFLALLSVAWSWSWAATAADRIDLDRNQPLELTDAVPTEAGNLEAQVSSQYERTQNGDSQVLLRPNLQAGITDYWQGMIQADVAASGDNRGSGDVALGSLFRLVTETDSVPAVALLTQAQLPTGINSQGLDGAVGVNVTKALAGALRAHLNGQWTHNAEPRADERRHLARGIVGFDYALGESTLLLLDGRYDDRRSAGESDQVVELGFLSRVASETQLGLGLGLGVGDSASDYLASLSLAQSL
jgi:hypothetical protein